MYQLICDKCYQPIQPGKDALRVDYAEAEYKGDKTLLYHLSSNYQKGEMILCPKCAQLVLAALGLKDEED